MRTLRVVTCLTLVSMVLLLPALSSAQVLGCSVVPESWGTVQQGLNTLAFGACARHDLCYRACNPIGGPYHGYGYKATCDSIFLADLLAACAAWSVILSFPNSEWVDQDDFLDDCAAVAAAAYVGVSLFGDGAFLSGQCEHCNQWACNQGGGFYDEEQCIRLCWPGLDRDNCDLFPMGPDCPICPIGLDLQGNGLKLTGPNPAVYFDLNGDGTLNHTSWTRVQTKDGFLVWDRNQNGKIDDGREMFGNYTPLLLSFAVPRHGYEALEEFDSFTLGGNGDSLIDSHDQIFEHLQIWLDENRDAVTQEGELKSLSELGVNAISLSYYRDDQTDQWGNVFRWWSPIYFEDGSISMSTDVFFVRLPSNETP